MIPRSCKRILGDTPVGAPECGFREASPECPRILSQLLTRRSSARLLLAAPLVAASCARKGPATPDRPLRVAVTPHITMAPIYLAVERKYFEAEGLTVNLESSSLTREAIPLISTGSTTSTRPDETPTLSPFASLSSAAISFETKSRGSGTVICDQERFLLIDPSAT